MAANKELNGENILVVRYYFEKMLPKALEYKMFFKRKKLLNLFAILK